MERYSSEYEAPDAPPDENALKLIAVLRPGQIQGIDTALLNACDHRWRKVAWVVGTVMDNMPDRVPGIPDSFYAKRVAEMVATGRLEAQGDLSRMRYSEVRLAAGVVR
ncbi:DUF3658 domain-containing protein [Lysobacter yananisis]|uniref:DUF3658 domain-containing protein n=1 Tax=Lysobacter yananisis TaxID=1003114 RepID=A0ABY9PFM0_9GAMM|nr:DUF3658 domain-containing protein [Lysobacter yananisis]WMT05669.1 DUF3658 domain-containing protein [Lysobacter yananisis]